MGRPAKRFSCQSCGAVIKCPPGEAPCEALKGWLTVSHWGGPGTVGQYHFCSFGCLESWVETQLPKVPGVFLKSFGEEESR